MEDLDGLRRAVLGSAATVAAVAAGLAALFWIVLEPPASDGCTTSLRSGTYETALALAHLAAVAALGACLLLLSARRSPSGRPARSTLAALAVIALYALLSLVWPGLLGIVALVALLAAAPVALGVLVAVVVNTAVVVRDRRRGVAPWPGHAGTVRLVLWAALVVGVPAHLALAYGEAVDIFCF